MIRPGNLAEKASAAVLFLKNTKTITEKRVFILTSTFSLVILNVSLMKVASIVRNAKSKETQSSKSKTRLSIRKNYLSRPGGSAAG